MEEQLGGRTSTDEHYVKQMITALDCLNAELGQSFMLSERLPGKSGAWAIETSCGDRAIDMIGLVYMVEPDLIPQVRHAARQVASDAALTLCGVYWAIRRLYQGIGANDKHLERLAQQMLTHIDLLIW